MRRYLLASTCLFAVALPLHAETLVDAKRVDPVSTSTIKAGTRDDIRITTAGSIVTTSGTAVIIDSVNKVTNEGTIQITNVDGATGILANSGTGGGIVNSGKIIVDETYEPTDIDKDGDLDGPFAAGTSRTGIRTTGAYAGPITNSGTITVKGNASSGIYLGGPLTGTFTHNGGTSVVGSNTTGVRLADVIGNVRLAGTITASGQGAVAARLDGNINGALVVQGALSSSGYRYTTPPTDTSKLDADDLLQGGATLIVGADVSGGIVFAVPPKNTSTTDPDVDKDGIEDAKEGSAAVTSYGSAAAVQIGSATRGVTIGPVAGSGTGFGLVIDGGISGQGVYAGVDGNGLVLGGLGQTVTVAGGIGVNGTVQAASNGASATAIRIGSGTSTPEIRNAGTISAAGGGTPASRSTAILVEAGATLPVVRNSGTIKATAQAGDGTAAAIVDRSGTLSLVENSGTISASGALATSNRNIAIDVSANNGGVTVRQTAVASGIAAPEITGDILFGAGNDVLDIADGKVAGTTRFGAGSNSLTMSGDAAYAGASVFGSGNDKVTLGDTSSYTGTVDFGGGADTLTLSGKSVFTGTLANASGLAVNVSGGTLALAKTNAIASLAVGSSGVLAVTLDKTGGTGTLIQVAGNASFIKGAQVAVKMASLTDAEGRYVFLRAGSITGGADVATTTALLPFMFKGTLNATVGNELAIDIARKTTAELGLNRSESTAYSAIYTALSADAKVGSAFLDITDGNKFRTSVRSMLPDHAGGSFEAVTSGSRATARMLGDAHAPFKDEGRWGYWITQVGWGVAKSLGNTASYNVTGWGIAGGAETKTGIGNFGTSLAYMWSRNTEGGTDSETVANQYELAGYWRGQLGGFSANARVSAAKIDFDGLRKFSGSIGAEKVERISKDRWHGNLVSGSAGLAYEGGDGVFFFRPSAAIDYYRLDENGYASVGGGKSLDLIVAGRKSDELTATANLAAGLLFSQPRAEDGWMRVEVEGGRRQILSGTLGATTANFADGQKFTLVPDKRTNGWVGKLRASGGSSGFRLGGEFSAEQQQNHVGLALRASLQIGL
jgi:hypothetical protein